MWFKVSKDLEINMLKEAVNFTSNHIIYGEAMVEVAFEWENTMINHLSNLSINRRAFLGHCAVCYKLGIPEYITRKAWSKITDKQRVLADNVAQQTINKWELWYMKKLKNTSRFGKKDVTKMDCQIQLQLD